MSRHDPMEATNELFELYGDEVYRYVRFTLGRCNPDVEDVVQDIFLQVMKSWPNFNYKSSPKTWLFSIANNMIRNWFRKQKNSKKVFEQYYKPETEIMDDPSTMIDLEASLFALTLEQRQVFIQRIIHGMSTLETSMSLGWSESKVKVTLHRALKTIRKLNSDQDVINYEL